MYLGYLALPPYSPSVPKKNQTEQPESVVLLGIHDRAGSSRVLGIVADFHVHVVMLLFGRNALVGSDGSDGALQSRVNGVAGNALLARGGNRVAVGDSSLRDLGADSRRSLGTSLLGLSAGLLGLNCSALLRLVGTFGQV